MAVVTKYALVNDSGRVQTVTGGAAAAAELLAAGATTNISYTSTIDDKFDGSVGSMSRHYINNGIAYSWAYTSEWFLLVNDSNGTSFAIGENCRQALTGKNIDWVCTGFEPANTANWQWTGMSGSTVGTALMTIADCGPTGGTEAGITSPTGGDSGAGTAAGPEGMCGSPYPVTGLSTGAAWDVIGIVRRIEPQTIGEMFMNYEIDSLGTADYSALAWGSGGQTIDLTDVFGSVTGEHDIEFLQHKYHHIKLSHEVNGTTHANSIVQYTLYDTNGVGYTLDCISGGTPDAAAPQFDTLYFNYLQVDEARGISEDRIRAAYEGIGTTAGLDSVFKCRTFFEGRQ